jgi:hypothetical protein
VKLKYALDIRKVIFKYEINELEIVRKDKISQANEFKESYQPRRNFVKGDNYDLLVDSHSILCRICVELFVSYWIMIFSRTKYTKQSYY